MFRKLVLASLFLTGCLSNNPKGDRSVLIVAIPHFKADSLDCRPVGESATPNMSQICSESIRFTHAYTTSVLENAALASILTGLYPVEHGVRSNAASVYEEGVVSVAQLARSQGLVTIFVSGGVPALRKSAISVGFDDFDDLVRENRSYYRPAPATATRLLSLLSNRADRMSFFSVVEFNDLLFPTLTARQDVPGLLKEGSVPGRLSDIDEGIGRLRSYFKKIKIWDAMTVVIVGLEGFNHLDRDGLNSGPYLYDEAVKVPLLIKPSRKPKDQGPGWKVDTPISLADVGKALIEELGSLDQESDFEVISLSPLLRGETLQETRRPLFTENSLPLLRGWGSRLIGVRLGEWLYWPGDEKVLFNTYSDRFQLHDLSRKDAVALQQIEKVWDKYKDRFEPNFKRISTPLPISVGEKMRVAQSVFDSVLSSDEKHKELSELRVRRMDDWQVLQWMVSHLITQQNWPELHSVLKSAKPKTEKQSNELGVWSDFLREKSGAKAFFGKQKNNPLTTCLDLGQNLKKMSPNEFEILLAGSACADPETDMWLKAYFSHRIGDSSQLTLFLDSARSYSESRQEQTEFAKLFWVAGACWDFNESLPEGPAFLDLLLNSTSSDDFRNFVKKNIY